MTSARTRAQAVTAAGLLTALLGAFLVFAGPAGASPSPNDYDFTVTRTVNENGTPGDTSDDTTTFTYTLVGLKDNDGISHAVFAKFCTTPVDYATSDFEKTDPSTGSTGLKIDDIGVGDSISFDFEGDVPSTSDGATITIKQGNGFRVASFEGPDCSSTPPPEECPEGTDWVDANQNQVVDEGECHTPPPEECPEGTDWVDANQNQVVDEGECHTPPPEECPEGTDWVDANQNQVVDEGECHTPPPEECPEGTDWVDANQNQVVDEGECQTPTPPPSGCVDDPQTTVDECATPSPSPEPASLTIVKAVNGDAPTTWSFDFDGGDTLGEFDLSNSSDSIDFDGLDAGTYTVAEVDAGDADLSDIDCGDAVVTEDIAGDGSTGSVAVTLAEGDAVTCTFTNTYPSVLPSEVEVEPAVTPLAPSAPEVLGETTTRTLPRTGDESGALATVGAALLALGTVLTVGSRRRLRHMA